MTVADDQHGKVTAYALLLPSDDAVAGNKASIVTSNCPTTDFCVTQTFGYAALQQGIPRTQRQHSGAGQSSDDSPHQMTGPRRRRDRFKQAFALAHDIPGRETPDSSPTSTGGGACP